MRYHRYFLSGLLWVLLPAARGADSVPSTMPVAAPAATQGATPVKAPVKPVAVPTASLTTKSIGLLLAANRYDEVEAQCRAAELTGIVDTTLLYAAQKARVEAALAQGKPAEALGLARSLFNVAPLKSTSDAIALLCLCIHMMPAADVVLREHFADEQIAGAKGEMNKPVRSAALLGIVITDAPAYLEAARQMDGVDMASRVARGNLYLLAGQADAALREFEAAYAISSNNALGGIAERMAASLKAADGTIGRANAFAASLRPPGKINKDAAP